MKMYCHNKDYHIKIVAWIVKPSWRFYCCDANAKDSLHRPFLPRPISSKYITSLKHLTCITWFIFIVVQARSLSSTDRPDGGGKDSPSESELFFYITLVLKGIEQVIYIISEINLPYFTYSDSAPQAMPKHLLLLKLILNYYLPALIAPLGSKIAENSLHSSLLSVLKSQKTRWYYGQG